MKVISNAEFGGERPLFESHDLRSLSTVVSSMSEDVRRYGTPTI